MDGVRPLRLMWCGHQDGWGCCWGLRRGIAGCRAWAWAVDSLASLAVWTCCILYQDCWGSPPTQQRSPSSLTDGFSRSFIWGFLPWACIYPICIPERPQLFLLLPAPLLPFWPCCQRPLVLGWLRGRAWPLKATQVLGSLCDTLGLACGKRRREKGLLEALPRSPFCSLLLRPPLCSLALPSSGTMILFPDEGEPETKLEEKI